MFNLQKFTNRFLHKFKGAIHLLENCFFIVFIKDHRQVTFNDRLGTINENILKILDVNSDVINRILCYNVQIVQFFDFNGFPTRASTWDCPS